jgi:hypothetical protein
VAVGKKAGRQHSKERNGIQPNRSFFFARAGVLSGFG